MNTTERAETTFDGSLTLLDILRRLKAQGRYCLHRGQNIFYAVMQLFQQDALQFSSNLLLRGVNARLRQQPAQIEVFGLQRNFLVIGGHASPSLCCKVMFA